MWPYTRLVHVFSAPLVYLVRPYIVYRSKDPERPDERKYFPCLGNTDRATGQSLALLAELAVSGAEIPTVRSS
ncbi:MAG: respiratory nitrate reductase subunit gamma [Pseudonocardiaceae bacterium]